MEYKKSPSQGDFLLFQCFQHCDLFVDLTELPFNALAVAHIFERGLKAEDRIVKCCKVVFVVCLAHCLEVAKKSRDFKKTLDKQYYV